MTLYYCLNTSVEPEKEELWTMICNWENEGGALITT